ncbi:uncharacterized protein LOC125645832 isoform X2 [Ostrea edulis]|uniref:uncharacterized protein LOC125645832 isoform X2 n=1 Tax=Ostrea edulis TaxID=37623 RepID=UPI0024AEB10C|nr:uncharacterized protein LOC125645832 isoform X2 [Ostrea edulis]
MIKAMFPTFHKASTSREQLKKLREQKAAYENRSAATGEEPDLKPAEDEQSESRMFAAVDERMEKQEEQMEEIELPAVIHAKSPSPLPEDIGNPVGCVKRTLGIIDSLS